MNIDTVLSDSVIQQALSYAKRKNRGGRYGSISGPELPDYWKKHGAKIKNQIRSGAYTPQPFVKRLIPKPGKSKMRKLEIPCIIDRMILYAIHLTLSPCYEQQFSPHSYGFRKGKGCPDALASCLDNLNHKGLYIVDLDIKSFFDNVNHDLLLRRLKEQIKDPCLLHLIKKYLKVKIIAGRHLYQNYTGLSQGSACSPLLANIYLDSFDKYLEQQKTRFVRYADDILIFCETRSEAEEKLAMAKSYLSKNLKLKLNMKKTDIVQPEQLEYLGYSFSQDESQKFVLTIGQATASKMMEKMQRHIESDYASFAEWWQRLAAFHRGWINYYKDASADTMIPFLQYAEQCELIQILNKMSKGSPKSSQECITGLYHSLCYSSLTGWYKYKIINHNTQLLRRMHTMSDKYTYWRSHAFCKKKSHLEMQYEYLLEKPYYYNEYCCTSLRYVTHNTEPCPDKPLNHMELQIIGILAAGKNMTLSQLASYLLLLGNKVIMDSLRETVLKLIGLGILKQTEICRLNENKSISQKVTCYQIAFSGMPYVKQICAPSDFRMTHNGFGYSRSKAKHFFKNTILWNQIILNFILYIPGFRRYEISSVLNLPNYRKLVVPLYVETEHKNYFFELMHPVFPGKIQQCFQKWSTYQKHKKRKITFVALTYTYDEMCKARTLLLNETISPDGSTMNTVFTDNIEFSIIHSWFHCYAGILIPF